jgi:hypothetical protein
MIVFVDDKTGQNKKCQHGDIANGEWKDGGLMADGAMSVAKCCTITNSVSVKRRIPNGLEGVSLYMMQSQSTSEIQTHRA